MDCKTLMINDWVLVKEEPTKVREILEDDFINGTWCCSELESCVQPYDVEPIPLSEEILKANGFELVESSFHLNIKGGLHLAIKKCRNDYKLKVVKSKTDNEEKGHTNSRRWRIPEIVYVHELQHALRLCGLTELADNFKIK